MGTSKQGEPEGAAACWSVYLVRRADGALYTGIATDVERRLAEHRAGRGAKALRGRGPLELVVAREVGEHGLALRVEHAVKALPKDEKEALATRRGALRRMITRLTKVRDEARAGGGKG